MGILLDILIIATLLISIVLGYKKGLINVAFNLCAFIIALIITLVLYRPITNFVIENTEFDEKIESVIIEKGISNDEKDTTEDGTLNKYIEEYVTKSVDNTKNEIVKSTATIIAEKIIGIVVMIALFVITRILLIFAKAIINGIANLPIIKQFNELGGLLYGILRGLVIVYGILTIMFIVISMNNNGVLANAIDTSIISKILYENNIILNIIFK
mgnify:FL=1